MRLWRPAGAGINLAGDGKVTVGSRALWGRRLPEWPVPRRAKGAAVHSAARALIWPVGLGLLPGLLAAGSFAAPARAAPARAAAGPASRDGQGVAGGPAAPAGLPFAVTSVPVPSSRAGGRPPPRRLFPADALVVGRRTLPPSLLAAIRRLPGVASAVAVDAGRITVDGVFADVLGVDPVAFRPFAAGPTARSPALWRNVAAGAVAVSWTMGSQERLSLTRPVAVTGARALRLPVAGFGTVGIGDVDAVVSRAVAARLGLPTANAIVISAPRARLGRLVAQLRRLAPPGAGVAALVSQVLPGRAVAALAGAVGVSAGTMAGLTSAQVARFLAAATSRVGMPYVWGGDGPRAFDCSGLVQWSLAQAGVVMPRVAADQARTGPMVPLSQLRPGDLLFYHTDPTAPGYISHVAIYLGHGLMVQAPQPGMDVQIVPADFGAGFAGAIRVIPRIAAVVAASPAG